MPSPTFCGTGGFTGPLPGDPSNNSILSATAVFGGVEVNWTFPGLNPWAVAHVRLYRSTSSVSSTAVLHKIVDGNFFFDASTTVVLMQYWYWIEIVSVHGTIGELIGPATATAKPRIDDMLILLAQQIDEGVLATALRTEISRIQPLSLDLTLEAQNRIDADDALTVLVSTAQGENDTTRAMLIDESAVRATENSAFVSSLNAAVVKIDSNTAAVITETNARVTADSALASQITTVQAELDTNISAVTTETTARVAADNLLSEQITTVQSQTATDLSAVQVNLQTNIDTTNINLGTTNTNVAGIDTRVTGIGALWTAQVTVNGLVGGFGVFNNGNVVQAGFDVDEFFIGRTGADKKKPFIMTGGVIFMDNVVIRSAVIEDAAITNLKLAGQAITVDKLAGGINMVRSASDTAVVSLPANDTNQVWRPTGGKAVLASAIFDGHMIFGRKLTFQYRSPNGLQTEIQWALVRRVNGGAWSVAVTDKVSTSANFFVTATIENSFLDDPNPPSSGSVQYAVQFRVTWPPTFEAAEIRNVELELLYLFTR